MSKVGAVARKPPLFGLTSTVQNLFVFALVSKSVIGKGTDLSKEKRGPPGI